MIHCKGQPNATLTPAGQREEVDAEIILIMIQQ